MTAPASRPDFKEYLLRNLGKPVIEINVSDDQVEDRIDEGLRYFWDYHFDGIDKTFYKYIITDVDATNKYITMPDNIIGVTNIFDIGSAISTNNLFDIRYQIALNELYTLTNVSMIPYYMNMQHIQLLEMLLVGKQPLRYNRKMQKCFIDMDWHRVDVGQTLIIEAYEVVDPTVYSKVWQDRWLLKYCTELVKRQWGNNLKKFSGMALPGGVTFNGQQIHDEAEATIAALEADMTNSYGGTLEFMIG